MPGNISSSNILEIYLIFFKKYFFKIKGLPRPKVVWSKDGMVIINSENKKIQNITDIDHCLEIKNCNRYNSGIYSVRATNDYGYCTTKFEVLVKDVPDPPSGPLEVKLNSKAKTAFIEWKPPILNGGCDIFGYNVEYLRFETLSEGIGFIRFSCLF